MMRSVYILVLLMAGHLSAAKAAAPRILVQPQSVDVVAGTNHTLTVVAEGTAPLSYQWYIWNTNYPLTYGRSETLTLTNVGVYSEEFPFQVRVSNQKGSVLSDAAVVRGHRIPQVTGPITYSPRRPAEDDLVGFEPGIPFSVTDSFQWFINGVAIPNGTNYFLGRGPFTVDDLGEYSVRVSNPIAAATNEVRISSLFTNTGRWTIPKVFHYFSEIGENSSGEIYVAEWRTFHPLMTIRKFARDFTLLSSNTFDFAVRYSLASGAFKVNAAGDQFVALEKTESGESSLAKISLSSGVSLIPLGKGEIGALWIHPLGALVAFGDTTSASLRLIPADGSVGWTTSVPPFATGGWGFSFSDIVVDGDGTIFYATSDKVLAIEATGRVRWEIPVDGVSRIKPGPNGTVYVRVPGSLKKFSATGELLWSKPTQPVSLPWLNGELAVDRGGDCYVLNGVYPGKLTKISADGRFVWGSPIRWYENAKIALGDQEEGGNCAVYLVYEHSEQGGVLSKFSSNGTRRWERSLPGMVSYGAENRMTFKEAYAFSNGHVWVPGDNWIEIIEDRETVDESRVNVQTEVESVSEGIRLKGIVTGTEAVGTNRWTMLGTNSQAVLIVTNELFLPFVTAPRTVQLEVDLPNATLASPEIDVGVFSVVERMTVVGDRIQGEVRTIPNLSFRCLISENLRDWSELPEVFQADAEGLAVIELAGGEAKGRFYRLVRR